jgi:hypothetical protein
LKWHNSGKKPVIIEAEQFFMGANPEEWPEGISHDQNGYYVTTIHGQRAYLADGDWIMPEPSTPGRFYPCKPDVFAEFYEPVVDTLVTAR